MGDQFTKGITQGSFQLLINQFWQIGRNISEKTKFSRGGSFKYSSKRGWGKGITQGSFQLIITIFGRWVEKQVKNRIF